MAGRKLKLCASASRQYPFETGPAAVKVAVADLQERLAKVGRSLQGAICAICGVTYAFETMEQLCLIWTLGVSRKSANYSIDLLHE